MIDWTADVRDLVVEVQRWWKDWWVIVVVCVVTLLLTVSLIAVIETNGRANAPILPCKKGCPLTGYHDNAPVYTCSGRGAPRWYKCAED